jgi:hypothetical protein
MAHTGGGDFLTLEGREVSPDERVRLVEWLKNPDTRLALQVAQSSRPSLMSHPAWQREISAAVSQNFQSMLQGWDLHLAAIIKACTPPARAASLGQEYEHTEDMNNG